MTILQNLLVFLQRSGNCHPLRRFHQEKYFDWIGMGFCLSKIGMLYLGRHAHSVGQNPAILMEGHQPVHSFFLPAWALKAFGSKSWSSNVFVQLWKIPLCNHLISASAPVVDIVGWSPAITFPFPFLRETWVLFRYFHPFLSQSMHSREPWSRL